MNTKFVNVKVFSLYSDDWDVNTKCYTVNSDIFAKDRVSTHSIRLDEIVDVEHRVRTMKLVAGYKMPGVDLWYHYIKVKTPDGHGINGLSTDIKVSEASYKRICNALGVNAEINDEFEVIY